MLALPVVCIMTKQVFVGGSTEAFHEQSGLITHNCHYSFQIVDITRWYFQNQTAAIPQSIKNGVPGGVVVPGSCHCSLHRKLHALYQLWIR